jgi:hypothetical protein
MKNQFLRLLGPVALVAGLLAACASPLSQSVSTGSGKGSVKIAMPAIAGWVKSTTSKALRSRAFVAADRVEITVYSKIAVATLPSEKGVASGSTGEVIASWTLTPSSAMDGTLAFSGTDGTLDVGDYSLTAQVFNAQVSTSVPVVTGASGPFTINEGQPTNVTVTCVPFSVTSLTVGTPVENQTLGVPWNWNLTDPQNPILESHGGEVWYSVQATSTATKITVTPTADGNGDNSAVPMIGVFDGAGAQVGYQYALTSEAISLTWTTEVGATYYVVATNNGGTEAAGTVSLAVSEAEGSALASVTGTITLPASVTDVPFVVMVDPDTDGGNGNEVFAQGTANGNQINYSVEGVSPGPYYVYAIVYASGTAGGPPTAGDLFGAYGITAIGQWPPTGPNAEVVAGSNALDFALYSTGGASAGHLVSEVLPVVDALNAGCTAAQTVADPHATVTVDASGSSPVAHYVFTDYVSGGITVTGTMSASQDLGVAGSFSISGSDTVTALQVTSPASAFQAIEYLFTFTDGTVWSLASGSATLTQVQS